jgi:hypothetical protein
MLVVAGDPDLIHDENLKVVCGFLMMTMTANRQLLVDSRFSVLESFKLNHYRLASACILSDSSSIFTNCQLHHLLISIFESSASYNPFQKFHISSPSNRSYI